MTSGGDSQGMNAAIRAVVRTGIAMGIDVYAICEGYQGLVDDQIVKMDWESVGGIMEQGGTVIGAARCKEFRTYEGRLICAENLIKYGIDNLVIIGGDGSLTGANTFSEEWAGMLPLLVKSNKITATQAAAHPRLRIIGMVGSIDNDMANTDMTIGADTALHRITEAIDALISTAASHQRIFVVEVMGRNCGYLALMSAIATGCEYVFIPEHPPAENWQEKMCAELVAGRKAGRRDGIIIVAEGAKDLQGNPIPSSYIKQIIEEKLGWDTRETILGHVQRGGAPSAFDRYMSTAFGWASVQELLKKDVAAESSVVVLKENRVKTAPLMESVRKTQAIAAAIQAHEYDKAQEMRGSSWSKMLNIFNILSQSGPSQPCSKKNGSRVAVMTCGWPAPGMNNAIRAVVRVAMDQGHAVLGAEDGINGLISGKLREFAWMDVEEWNNRGGTVLDTNRKIPEEKDFYSIAKTIEEHKINGLIMIGGWSGYQVIESLFLMRKNFKTFNLPMLCIPAAINNNLPGSELAIGADTALNTIVEAVDKIKHSSDSSRRAFMVEVMGRYCGYLALMSGLATGAEYIYLHEKGVTLELLQQHLKELLHSFEKGGRHVALMIRNENANPTYTTDFICELFQEAGKSVFAIRKSILGPMQQGGAPSPFDRIQAVRLAFEGANILLESIKQGDNRCCFIGQNGGETVISDMNSIQRMVDEDQQRPAMQWWESLYDVAMTMAQKPK
jgi:6-phosphofructokinase 1